ncbi:MULTISPECIES: ELKS/Rab6-interacting/CAST family protein [Lysinibacillus]|uniref:ELKS/Rab6-interacting/CAST family protein n=1 Tax=Lysinibacillus TaxID=400634 RepID=UPI0021081CDE|nr:MULTISPECIES: ELKS/Rab6-interacting/CAST family protein [Lysinibacillus]UUV25585.1 ELKS/Rab6-interacting/CAST family protein [Lysinibacillus sp. FN11]UYB48459.1 ELKS/Rab6-interacting/CAST family protein [Lysinibacillus capsici]WDU80672.1 2-oxoglutarate ferredoxin oxidoreductase subunit beta [Lysinibacillus sp. G01H]WHP39486.1 2-oxoglutarate ferredoxin oxidoreductase subunit beta [Lysinibacillus boronitolerans]
MYVNNVIDFIAKKKEREDRKRAQDLERYVATQCNFQHPENIDALVEDKLIEVKDHTLFLGFLSILKDEQIEPLDIFQDVFSLEPPRFEMSYNMRWWSVVQLAFTFLTILKENEPHTYADFLGLSK